MELVVEQCTVAGTSRRKLEWKEEAEGSSRSLIQGVP